MQAVDHLFRPGGPFFFIAGPCAIESDAQLDACAETLSGISDRLGVPIIFKASYLKDNRTRGGSYRGPGIESGLTSLARVRERWNLPITSDVHAAVEVGRAAEVLDVLQIPAFLCRQSSLLEAAAGTGRPVNVKKGQFLAPAQVRWIVEKLTGAGSGPIAVTERGSSFGHGDLVVDARSFPILAELPIVPVFDATHALQRPGGAETGGDRAFLRPLARAALGAGARALFFETHPDPPRAMSDRETQLPLEEAEPFVSEMARLAAFLREERGEAP